MTPYQSEISYQSNNGVFITGYDALMTNAPNDGDAPTHNGVYITGSGAMLESAEVYGPIIAGRNSTINIPSPILLSGVNTTFDPYQNNGGFYVVGSLSQEMKDSLKYVNNFNGILINCNYDEPYEYFDLKNVDIHFPETGNWNNITKLYGHIKLGENFALYDCFERPIILNGQDYQSTFISNNSPIMAVPNSHVLTDEEYSDFLEMREIFKEMKTRQ